MNLSKKSNDQILGDCLNDLEKAFKKADIHFGHGTDNPWDEAVQLVSYVLNLPPDVDRSVLSHPLTAKEIKAIQLLADKRIKTKKPLSYLTHQAWFMQCSFYVDERVLISRSLFAEWIERQFAPWIDPDKVHHILDIGTGSGCIAISCALTFPEATVDAVDISEDALKVAQKNVEAYKLNKRVKLIQSNCFENLSDKKYDVIISNPPYVGDDEMATLPREYQYEPKLALCAGEDGLAVVRVILKEAGKHLNEEGILLVEVGDGIEKMEKAFPKIPFIWLDQVYGEEGAFLLTRDQLDKI